jgi:hypothetical protein
VSDSEPEHRVTEHTQIRLSLADLLAELALGTMAREVEMNDDEETKVGTTTSMVMSEAPVQPG